MYTIKSVRKMGRIFCLGAPLARLKRREPESRQRAGSRREGGLEFWGRGGRGDPCKDETGAGR
jgi:hypothetical protein